MKSLLVLPVIIPMFTAACCLLVWPYRRVQRVLAMLGATAMLVVAVMLLYQVDHEGIQAVQMGGWPAPFGITFAADLLGAIMVTLGAIMGFAVVVYSLWSMDEERESFGYYPLLMALLMGVSGAFLTGDLFNLYVWFEVMLMASFVLLALGGEQAQLEGAIKYVTLNLISSTLFLTAVGILYGVAGTLNMAELSIKLSNDISPVITLTLAMLFLVAFGIKAGAFPLFFWLPASYHTPPVAVSAIFAGLLTKVGIYALIRVFTLLFIQDISYTHQIILVISGFTMLSGVLGAASQYDFRRILAFHCISQIGYMMMGLAIFTPLALAGSIYFIMHHALVKFTLFLISGVSYQLQGTYDLKKLGNLYKNSPFLALLFMLLAMSLAGIPPLSGFFAKLGLIIGGLKADSYGIVAVALVVSVLTLYSMTKIWAMAFWKAAPEDTAPPSPENIKVAHRLMIPIAVLAVMTLGLGLGANFFFSLSMRAAEQLLHPEQYIETVLGYLP